MAGMPDFSTMFNYAARIRFFCLNWARRTVFISNFWAISGIKYCEGIWTVSSYCCRKKRGGLHKPSKRLHHHHIIPVDNHISVVKT